MAEYFRINSRSFQSTLSLRRATESAVLGQALLDISIHALLAESDFFWILLFYLPLISIHALLAESDTFAFLTKFFVAISIHALLAESDLHGDDLQGPVTPISIHALLAESDQLHRNQYHQQLNFNPRSPCGERPRMAYNG